MPRRYQRVAAHPGDADMRELRELLSKAQAPAGDPRRRRLEHAGCEPTSGVRRGVRPAGGMLVPLPGPVRQPPPRTTPATSASASIRSWPQRIREADLLLVVGARLGEMTTGGYTLLEVPRPRQTLVHVHAGAEELGRVYQADLPINAGMPEFAAAAALQPPTRRRGRHGRRAARATYLDAWHTPVKPCRARCNMARSSAGSTQRLPPETPSSPTAPATSRGWVHRFYRYGGFRTQLGPPPAPWATACRRRVARQARAPRAAGGRLRRRRRLPDDRPGARHRRAVRCARDLHRRQQRHVRHHPHAPGTRLSPAGSAAPTLQNPDFAALARAYGLHGETVEATADFEAAFERCWSAKTASLIEVRIDPDAISPRASLSSIRAEAKKNKKG